MKLKNVEKMAFISLGVMAVNAALMANGVETMPDMWVKEVYQDPLLGASIGSITGFGIGGVVGAAYVATSETVKAGISALRKQFNKQENTNKLAI